MTDDYEKNSIILPGAVRAGRENLDRALSGFPA